MRFLLRNVWNSLSEAQRIPRRELLFTVPYMEKAGIPADVGQKAFIVSFRIQLFL